MKHGAFQDFRAKLSHSSDPSIKALSATRHGNEKLQHPAPNRAMSTVETLEQTQAIGYVKMASATVVMYDEVLNFSQEVDLIWNRRWTFMTGLYFAARYCGSVSSFTLIAMDLRLTWTRKGYESMYIASQWLDAVFTAAMQVILLVRVYALYSRSKKVLAFLLACFCCEAIIMLVTAGTLFNFSAIGRFVVAIGPKSWGSVEEEGALDYSALEPLIVVFLTMQVTFDVILLAFALFAAVKHAREARQLHGTWSISPLVKSLVADQIIYFIGNVMWQAALIPMIFPNSVAAEYIMMPVLNTAFNALAVVAGPHMVISLRTQELKTVEGTSHGELSTIQFGARDPPAQSVEEREPEPMVEHCCSSAIRQTEQEA